MTDTREEAIWSLLRSRAAEDAASSTGAPSSPRPNRESMVALLDAALGVLTATRHLVEVAEDVVRQQRDRMASDAVAPAHDSRDEAGAQRRKIHLTY